MDRREFSFFLGVNAVVLFLMYLWFLLFSTGCGGNLEGENLMISDLSGKLNLSDARKIPDQDYAIGRNLERLDGILQSRRGASKVNPDDVLPTGITAYFNNGAHGYVQAGTKIYRADTWAEIYTLESSAKLRAIPYKSYTQTQNDLFLGNGTDRIRIGTDRLAYKWGIGTPSVSSDSGALFASSVIQWPGNSAYEGGIAKIGTDLYLCDGLRNSIIKVTSAGVVSVFAGEGVWGVGGSTDGTGTAARFNKPRGITAIGTDLYVADALNHTIRKITTPGAVVTTIAGSPGTHGSADGTGSAARFYEPTGITTDGTDLFVADRLNSTIRQVTTAGVVTTLAGLAFNTGFVDDTGSAARFRYPFGITAIGTDLYIADKQNHAIRKCTAAGVVTTIAGDNTGVYPGYVNGTGSAARFTYPSIIETDGTNLIVLDQQSTVYRKVTTAGVVTDWELSASSGNPGAIFFDSGYWYINDNGTVPYGYSSIYQYKLLTLAASGAGLTGDYWVAFAYARKVGSSVAHVGNPSTPVQITGLADDGISVSGLGDPSDVSDIDYDPQVTHLFVYRSRAGGGQYQLYKDVELNVGTTSVVLNQGDVNLGADIEWDNDLPPASAVIGRPDNQGYMFAAVGNRIYYSKASRPEAWPPGQSFDVGSPQWPVLAILYAKASTIIKTAFANHLLQGSGKSFVAIPFPVSDGAVGTDSCLADEGATWHLGKKGLYEMSGLGGQDIKISDGILDALWNGTASDGDSITLASIADSVLARAGDRVYLLYPGDSAADLSRILVVDTAKKQTVGIWKFPASIVPTCLTFDDSLQKLYLGAENGYLYELESGLTDDGTAIAYKVRSKDLYSGRYFPLSYGRADVEWPAGSTGPSAVLYADGSAAVSTGALPSRSPIRIIPVSGESAMVWSIEVSGSADGNGSHKLYALELAQ